MLAIWTFNLLRANGPSGESADWPKRTQLVIDAINSARPDAVALQEVSQSAAVSNRAEAIAAATGYHWVWQQEYDAFTYQEGIAVLSRWPILESEGRALPHLDAIYVTRYTMRARIDHPAGDFDLFCTHMTVTGGETQSADQAREALHFIRERPGSAPAWFGGDFNAGPDSLALRFLRGEAEHEGETGDLVDAWTAINPGDPGFTSSSDDPGRRIDYLLQVPVNGATPPVRSCQLLFTEPSDGTYASDHLGVGCAFTYP